MYRFAVCDDEQSVRNELKKRIEAYMGNRAERCVVRTFETGADFLEEPDADVVFLDIQMPGLNGMETARALRRAGSACSIVFTTVLEDYVFDAFEVDAADYIVKPVDPDRFCRTMDRLLHAVGRQDAGQLIVRTRNEVQIVPRQQIAYCEIHGRTMDVHLQDGGVLSYMKRMSQLESELGDGFFRCHRGCIVNLAHVTACKDDMVCLRDGSRLPVSRLREKGLRQALMRHLGSRHQ